MNYLENTFTMAFKQNIPSHYTQSFEVSLPSMYYYYYIKIDRDKYNELPVPDIDLRACCESIYRIIRLNTESGNFDSFSDRQFMYYKVQCYDYDLSMEIICQQAAFFGHFDCLKLAREIGVPFNHMYGIPSACSQAETNGQLECLKYLQEN